MSSPHLTLGEIHRFMKILPLFLLLALTACASTDQRDPQVASEDRPVAADSQNTAGQVAVEDPFEPFNRRIFAFNYRLDRWLLKPLAVGYDAIAPGFVEIGISNFFNNLAELSNTANSLLQWKWGQAGNDSGRFLINSTLGLAGLFDVASKAGLPQSDGEDFGQTMAVWGVEAGPYLMLPLLGPATIRDGIAMVPDSYTNPVRYVDPMLAEYSLRAVDLIDQRADVLETESLISGDSYTLLRDYYLQNRNYLINDGKIKDDFGSGGYDDDYYYDEYGGGE
jgi:phospholipid-binding lipoprotein MlaA